MDPFSNFFQNVGQGAQQVGSDISGAVQQGTSDLGTVLQNAKATIKKIGDTASQQASAEPDPAKKAQLHSVASDAYSTIAPGQPDLGATPTSGASAGMTPQSAIRTETAPPKMMTKTNGAVSSSTAGQFAGGVAGGAFQNYTPQLQPGESLNPNTSTSPAAAGAMIGSSLPAFGADVGMETAPDSLQSASPAVKDALQRTKGAVQESFDNAKGTYGGLQTGSINPGAFRAVKPGEVLPQGATTRTNIFTGEKVTDAPEVQNPVPSTASSGDKVTFQSGEPALGTRSAAEIKAQAGKSPLKAIYTPRAEVPSTEAYPTKSSEPPVTPGATFQNNGIEREALPMGNEETPPQTAQPSATESQPWQEFNEQQKSYQADPGQKAIRQINPAAFAKENDPVGTVNSIHETLDRYGITNPTAEEQLSVLPAKRTQIYQEAQAKIASDPTVAPLQTVTDNINKELASQTRLKDISAPAAKDAIDSYTANLYNEAMNTTNNPVPTTIPYKTLFDMKTLANKDYAKVVEKHLNNTPLTDVEKVNAAYRNGLDRTITARYPAVKQDTMDMSNMYKAQTPLAKAIPKYEAPKPTEPGMSKWTKVKDAAIAAAGFGAAGKELGLNPVPAVSAGVGALTHQFEQFFSKQSSANQGQAIKGNPNDSDNAQNNSHGYSMTQFDPNVKGATDLPSDGSNIKSLPDGTFGVANIFSWKDPSDPSGKTPLFTSAATIKDESDNLATMKGQLAAEGGKNPQLEGQIATLSGQIDAQKSFSDPVNNVYTGVLNANSAYSKAIQDAQAANLDLSNFNGSYNDLIKQIQPKNAILAADIEKLEKLNQVAGNGIVSGTLVNALQAGAQANLMTLYSTANSQLGYTGEGSTGFQATAPVPTTSAIAGQSAQGAPSFAAFNNPQSPLFKGGQPAISP